jgi:hypothetical protein
MNITLSGHLDTHRSIAPRYRVSAKFTRTLVSGEESAPPRHAPAVADGTVTSNGTFAIEVIPKEHIVGRSGGVVS